MDPRVRALLEPKVSAKSRKASIKNGNEGSSSATSPGSTKQEKEGRDSSQLPISPARSLPVYDPKKLLDPRGLRKAGKLQKSTPYLEQSDSPMTPNAEMRVSHGSPVSRAHRESSASRSMIEELYGVQRRVEPPAKRLKLQSDGEDVTSKSKSSARAHHSSGIIGEYMRPAADEIGPTTDHTKVVDLTSVEDVDDSDDDLKVVKARNINSTQVVCFGNIWANVHAHFLPQPRKVTVQNLYSDHQWPFIKCVAVRIPSKNTVIELKDPDNFTFGRIEPEFANILAPLLDGLKMFRLVVWLNPRTKKPHEIPHRPCSEVLGAAVNIYGRRIDAERVGKILGQRNIWLKNPTTVEKGAETVNPHADRFRSVIPQVRSTQRNNLYSENRTVEEATQAVTKLFDHYANTTRPLVETEPASEIMTPLLSHQKQALTFMLERERPRTFGLNESDNSSLWRKKMKSGGVIYYEETVTGITLKEEPDEVYGGLLADVMGLGKTIEALALIVSTRKEAETFGKQSLVRADASESGLIAQSRATLIVAPVSTVKNWEDQINEHIQPGTFSFYVYHGPNREKDSLKLAQYDIVISTYSTIATECSSRGLGISPIKAVRWFRIILDEAHTIRESRASQSQAMYSLFAQRRWCLTGTPIQNRLDDLGSLTRFLRLYPYDTTMRFNQYVRAPAQSGDDNYLKSLRVLIDSFTLRRLKDRVDLPDRRDLIVKLEFSKDEAKLHEFFKNRASIQLEEMSEEKKQRTISQHHVLRAIMTLRLICDHGRELLKEDDLDAYKGDNASNAIVLDDEDHHMPSTITPHQAHETLGLLAEADLDMCKQCDKRISGDSPRVEAENTDDVRGYMLPCYDLLCKDCFEYLKQAIDGLADTETLPCPTCRTIIRAQYVPIPKSTAELLDWAPEQTLHDTSEAYKKGTYTGPSTKVKALLDDLSELRYESDELVSKGEPPLKSVVFSEFTSNLDLIERGLDDHGFEGTYVRIDGSMTLNKRKAVLDSLNNDRNVTILLASIKAAGQGLNLVAASRAFIMEPMWNPAAEAQAVDRIYRIGQHRNVVVKRYQMSGSIELKIVELQRKKQALADISLNKNHSLLSKKESREKHMKEILQLFK